MKWVIIRRNRQGYASLSTKRSLVCRVAKVCKEPDADTIKVRQPTFAALIATVLYADQNAHGPFGCRTVFGLRNDSISQRGPMETGNVRGKLTSILNSSYKNIEQIALRNDFPDLEVQPGSI
jgi:hypothetical protein